MSGSGLRLLTSRKNELRECLERDVSGRLRPFPAVSGRLQPSPAVSSLKGASGFPLKIVNWPLINGELDSNQLASKSDPLVFHWQTISNSLEVGGWELVAGDWLLEPHGWWKWASLAWLVAGDWWLEARGQGLG